MRPLIDADVLLHELGWSGEFKDKETGEVVLLTPDHVFELLDKKIEGICKDVEATEPPVLLLSDSPYLAEQRKEEFVPNFRYAIAKTQPYKGNRKNPKPYHFYNLLNYMLFEYECVVSKGGLEADDEMCIWQRAAIDEDTTPTIICSRDKDLRICPGWHYSWECGSQGAIWPTHTDKVGWLELKGDKKDVLGYGLSFFYYQMLVGDSADYIPGLPGWGKAKAFNLLSTLTTEQDLFACVKGLYKEVKGEESREYFMEQANLLWIIQERGKGYEIPK